MEAIKKAIDKIKKFYSWVIEEGNILTGICEGFTVVTVINSYMMISGMDNPKIGRFAYIHLLMRLTIVSIFFVIWDYESAFQAFKKTITRIKNIKRISRINIKEIYKNVLVNKFASICIIYTLLIVIICIVMILGIYVPKGGEGLYFNLLLLFAFISIAVFFIYILEKIKSFFQRNGK